MIVQSVVDRVRMRHALFTEAAIGEGVIVSVIDTRQRSLLLELGGAIDGLVSQAIQLATVFSGVLIGQSGGVPVYQTTYADGWPVHSDANGFPYVDFAETPIAADPFGEHGGTPGFPLPADFLKLVSVTCVDANNRVRAVNIVAEGVRLESTRATNPTAFVSGNRLVPVRPLASGNSNDIWASGFTAVQLSYIALPVLTSLADVLVLPAVLMEPLIAGVAESLAFMMPTMSQGDKRMMSEAARRAEGVIGDYATDVIGDVEDGRVQYRG